MKNSLYFLMFILLCLSKGLDGQHLDFDKIKWETEKIAPGLVWKYSHTLLNDTFPQNINILIVNLSKRKIMLSYDPEKNKFTSTQAESVGAIAAVNAGFFNIRDGGSATYIRSNGFIVDRDTAKRWSRNENMTGSVLMDTGGHLFIEPAMSNGWYDTHPEYPDVLITGPLLISDSEQVQLKPTLLVVTRHPRTAIGKKGRHKIILITIDGRTDQAKGMSLTDLAELMLSLGCKDAVNLDGGGSTTMYISGKPFKGIVNMPCDNRKFDHEGERAVSDILIVK